MPKIFGAKNSSADAIAVLFGFTDEADMLAAMGGAPAIADITDWPSGLTATEIGYVNGVTSAIQTQIDAKQATLNSGNKLGLAAGGSNADLSATGGATHFLRQASTGAAVTVGAIAASDLPTGIDATKIGAGGVTDTEFGYLGGVTSDIQTQINALGGGGFTPKYARIARTTSNQTGISGSYAEDWLQYNTEDVDADGILTISGDDVTLAAAGTYLICQAVHTMPGMYLSLSVNGSHDSTRLQLSTGDYAKIIWIVTTTGANQIVKFGCISAAASTLVYTDGTRPGVVNYVEILRIA